MKTEKILFMLSAWLLTGAMVFAQNSGAQKGDVNRDGAINESDVPALIKIMREGGGISESDSAKAAGDLNGDDVVDVADLNALFKIIDNQGTTTEPVYYWYVGQTDPSTMTEISPIVTDKTSPGWRLIGTELPNYSSSNKLFEYVEGGEIITGTSLAKQYIAIPTESSACPRDGLGNDASTVDMYNKLSDITISGITYKIYETVGKSKKLAIDVY